MLRTEEISNRVDTKIQPTVPFVVHELLRRCSATNQTPGLSVKILDNETEIEALGYMIEFTERRHPFILVSPGLDGSYLANIDTLRFCVERLADVVQIPVGADTFFQAKSVFGESYSARESESVENNKRARKLRTFAYKGREIEMMKHLKIGVKPSAVETIRIHFEWEASERKIVIGYCGPHLDQN